MIAIVTNSSCILVIFIGFLVICSLCDVIQRQLDVHQNPVLTSLSKFSLQKNAAAILNLDEQRGNLPAIHGIRVISMAWVVLGHQYLQQLGGVNVNSVAFYNVSIALQFV